MSAPNVPLAKNYMLGVADEGVIAIKRALSRAGYMQWGKFTNLYGPNTKSAVQSFQHDHKIPLAGYGPRTHHALCNTHKKGSKEWAWDKIAIQLMTDEYAKVHTSPETRIRHAILAMAQYLYGYRMQIFYEQWRPFALIHYGDTPPRGTDCSGFFSTCWFAGGAINPNGRPWDGQGYTGTLLATARKCNQGELKLGDPVFYGYTVVPSPAFPVGSPTHVALYDGAGGVFSMGSYPMGHYPIYYRGLNCFATYDHVTP